MKIACLQFSPVLGDIDNNLTRADAVLAKANVEDLDLLVLPELAFTGYNFQSLQHISPYLEPTTSGISSLWARTTALKHDCNVIVGYPEKVDISPKWPASPEYYNSAIVVNRDGETISNYRKSFLYYTDSKWALEGPDGFYDGEIEGLGNCAIGICKWPTNSFERMDLNPYKFEAPWEAWEFAHHILHKQANLVVLSMAWRTREDARSYSRQPKEPDMDTLAYWLARLEPVIRAEQKGEIIVVFANRTGTEGDAVYTGTSAVLGICAGEVKVYGLLGRGEKELLVVDTSIKPKAKLVADPRPPPVPQETTNIRTEKSKRTDAKVPPSETRSKSILITASKTKSKSKTDPATFPKSTLPPLDPTIRDELWAGKPTPIGPSTSIDEILATVTPISPVEPTSTHAYFSTAATTSTNPPIPSSSSSSLSTSLPSKRSPTPAKLNTSASTMSPSAFDHTPTAFAEPESASQSERKPTSVPSPTPLPTPIEPPNSCFHPETPPPTAPIPPALQSPHPFIPPTPSKTSFRPVSPKSRNASVARAPIAVDMHELDFDVRENAEEEEEEDAEEEVELRVGKDRDGDRDGKTVVSKEDTKVEVVMDPTRGRGRNYMGTRGYGYVNGWLVPERRSLSPRPRSVGW